MLEQRIGMGQSRKNLMETTTTSPLQEEELKLFYGKECEIGAIFVKDDKRFAGLVFNLEYETGHAQVITNLNVKFYWVLEVKGDFLEPVTGQVLENVGKVFILPHKIIGSCRPGEILTCCTGNDHKDKIKFTKKPSHVLALATLKPTKEPEAT